MALKPDAPAAMGTSHSMVAGVDLSNLPRCQQGVSIFAHSQSANTGSMVLISFPQANCHLTKQIALWLDEFSFLIKDVSDSLGPVSTVTLKQEYLGNTSQFATS